MLCRPYCLPACLVSCWTRIFYMELFPRHPVLLLPNLNVDPTHCPGYCDDELLFQRTPCDLTLLSLKPSLALQSLPS